MRFRNFRVKRTLALVFVLLFTASYVAFNKHFNNENVTNAKDNARTDRQDPYRFQLQHAWAWNDDVIYVEENDGKPNESPQDEPNNPSIDLITNKSSSLAQDASEYGQNKFLGLEGVEDYILSKDDYQEQRKVLNNRRVQKCTFPVHNILFLKTHHTGSDIITNILNRFADLRDLRVAIPNGGVSTFYWPARFHWRHLDLSIHDGILPNILCNHARFNSEIMDQIMPLGTVYITMVRHPQTLFESTFDNEHFTALLDMFEYDDPIGSFLEDPKMHIEHVIKHNMFKDNLNLIKNSMFFDLGLRTADYHKSQVVRDAILDLDEKFTLVLIYEHLDESLVMLKRKLCWELDDVLYLKSYFKEETKHRNFTEIEKGQLKNWSKADYALYDHFNKTLWEGITYEENFFEELELFRKKQRQIEEICKGTPVSDDIVDSGEASSSMAQNMNKYLCYKMSVLGANYLEYFRTKFTVRKHGKSISSF